jgi:hypothetical protein
MRRRSGRTRRWAMAKRAHAELPLAESFAFSSMTIWPGHMADGPSRKVQGVYDAVLLDDHTRGFGLVMQLRAAETSRGDERSRAVDDRGPFAALAGGPVSINLRSSSRRGATEAPLSSAAADDAAGQTAMSARVDAFTLLARQERRGHRPPACRHRARLRPSRSA